MGDPHRIDRYGETWSDTKINAYLFELKGLQDDIILSGGWAWHFMSPTHTEFKHLHDHKDVDIFVAPRDVAKVIMLLGLQKFQRVATIHDANAKRNPGDFRRYEKIVENEDSDGNEAPFRITIDFFVGSPPHRNIRGWKVADVDFLLKQYHQGTHSSGECIAVMAARKIRARGLDPLGMQELIQLPLEV